MDKEVKWLKIIANLNFYKAKHGTAPHKPLLLLVVIDLVESGELASEVLELTPRLAFRFSSYGSVVAYRRTQPLIVRYPFFHLSSDGFWTALDKTAAFPENTRKPAAATGQGVVRARFFQRPTGERPSRARRGSPR